MVEHGRVLKWRRSKLVQEMSMAKNLVTEAWQQISKVPELAPLATVVGDFSRVSSLFPFTSLDRLCLSKCTEYPFWVDYLFIPLNLASRFGLTSDPAKLDSPAFIVGRTENGSWVDCEPLFCGSAFDSLSFLEETIPPNYGSARSGNAEDFGW